MPCVYIYTEAHNVLSGLRPGSVSSKSHAAKPTLISIIYSS